MAANGAVIGRWALAAAIIAAGVVVAAVDPAGSITAEAAGRAALAAAAAGGWGTVALGAGGALLRWQAPGLLEGDRGLLHASAAGLLAWGLGAGALAAMGGLGPLGLAALAAALGAGWLARPAIRWPALAPAELAAVVGLAAAGAIVALAPAITTDELYYHLALPRELLDARGLVGGVLRPDGNRPLLLHLPYAALLATGGEGAVRIFHLGTMLATLSGVVACSRAWVGPQGALVATALLIGSWTFLEDAGLASNNVPAALCALAVLDAAMRGEVRGMALAAGAALSVKYTAAGAVAGAFLVGRAPLRARVGAGLAALALVSPWWIRNALEGLHPLFPFAGWTPVAGVDFAFQYPEKYGVGRSLPDLLRLPWDAVARGEIQSFRFLGRLNPLWLLLVPAGLAALRTGGTGRRLTLAGAVAVVAWAAGPHWLRYLVPALPGLALVIAAGLQAPAGLVGGRPTGVALAVCFLLGLPASWGPILTRAADRLPAALGQESRDAFLTRNLDDWPAIAWANEHLPPDARVALLFNWSAALVERPTLLSSVEDHIPSRHWLLTHGEDSLDALRAAGATHLLTTRVHFLPSVYPFLDAETFSAAFTRPEALLDRLLLDEATLVYQQGRTRVYRLPPVAGQKSEPAHGDSP